jgi:hypothetical protein
MTENNRGGIAFVFVILLGLALGILIKRVHIGLLIGLVLGITAPWLLRRRK